MTLALQRHIRRDCQPSVSQARRVDVVSPSRQERDSAAGTPSPRQSVSDARGTICENAAAPIPLRAEGLPGSRRRDHPDRLVVRVRGREEHR